MNKNIIFSSCAVPFLLLLVGSPVCFATSSDAVSPQAGKKHTSLNSVVVTATRTPKLLVDSPVSVQVVSGDTLRQASQTTLARALDFVPGVVVKRSMKEGYNVYMQGFDGDRVLVLIDGRRVIAPTGASVDLDQISIATIERIEIMRGAGSVLYGSSAMGGVINIITRRDAGNQLRINSEASSYVGNEIEGDEIGFQHRLETNRHWGLWRANLQLQHIDDVGFDYQPETPAQTAGAMEKQFARLALGRDFSAFSGDYRVQIFDEVKQRDSYRLPGRSDLIYYLSDVMQVQHDLELRDRPASEAERNEMGSWKFNARHIDHQETSGHSTCLRDTQMQLTELDAQRAWVGNGYEWVAGFAARQDQLDQISCKNLREIDDKSAEGVEVFSQYSWLFSDNEVLGGIRLQHDSDFDWHSAVRLSGMKKMFSDGQGQWHLRGGVGQSYRVPTLKERFYVFDHSNLGYMILGNAALKPETALTGNASISYLHPLDEVGILETEVNVHYSKANNLIDTIKDDAASSAAQLDISRYSNFEQAQLYGADLISKYQYGNWNLQFNYSYLVAQDDISRERLPNRPRHQIKANVGHHFSRYQLDSLLYFVYEANEYSGVPNKPIAHDNYLSVNLNFTQKLTRDFSWRAGVDNIFNEHQDPTIVSAGQFDQRAISSRRVFVGISVDFF